MYEDGKLLRAAERNMTHDNLRDSLLSLHFVMDIKKIIIAVSIAYLLLFSEVAKNFGHFTRNISLKN